MAAGSRLGAANQMHAAACVHLIRRHAGRRRHVDASTAPRSGAISSRRLACVTGAAPPRRCRAPVVAPLPRTQARSSGAGVHRRCERSKLHGTSARLGGLRLPAFVRSRALARLAPKALNAGKFYLLQHSSREHVSTIGRAVRSRLRYTMRSASGLATFPGRIAASLNRATGKTTAVQPEMRLRPHPTVHSLPLWALRNWLRDRRAFSVHAWWKRVYPSPFQSSSLISPPRP